MPNTSSLAVIMSEIAKVPDLDRVEAVIVSLGGREMDRGGQGWIVGPSMLLNRMLEVIEENLDVYNMKPTPEATIGGNLLDEVGAHIGRVFAAGALLPAIIDYCKEQQIDPLGLTMDDFGDIGLRIVQGRN